MVFDRGGFLKCLMNILKVLMVLICWIIVFFNKLINKYFGNICYSFFFNSKLFLIFVSCNVFIRNC